MVTGDDVRAAGASVVELLTPVIDSADWERTAGVLEWTCRHALAHLVDCTYWYAGNLVRRSTSSVGSPDVVGTVTPVAELVDMITSAAELLALAVDNADDGARGWHPAGMADRSGFAAMGCDEMLVHAYDITSGLALTYDPPGAVVERTLRRLFPWVPTDADPWTALIWANGRAPLGDVAPPGIDWQWHCAPLDEWDGTIPRWTG
jgi:uncharacterized protein (TIGR03083 family)